MEYFILKIGNSLYNYANSKNIDEPLQIYKDLAWGGLRHAPIFDTNFPTGSAERLRIINRYASEGTNQKSEANHQSEEIHVTIKKIKNQLVLFVISTIFYCCSSAKNIGSPINNYLDTTLKDSVNKIIILDKKIPNKRTLGIFKGDYMFNTKTSKYEREGRSSPLYNKKDWESVSKKFTFDTIAKYWEVEDFNIKNAIIANYDKFLKGELYKDFKNSDYPVYSFSETISYKNNKYVLFTVLQSSTSFGSEFSEYVIIMENKNNKWVVIDKVWGN